MDNKQNEWARRRAQADLLEKFARIAGTLLDAGVINESLSIADRQAYVSEIRALNQRIDQAIRGIRNTFASIL